MRSRKATANTAQSGGNMAFCHGSVCVGNKVPTNCICPATKK